MSERENLNRWRDLAEELGLPPEPTSDTAPSPRAPSPPVREPVMEEIREPFVPPPVIEAPPPNVEREPPPREEGIGLPAITSLDPPTLDPMLDVPAQHETFFEDPRGASEAERPRGRGGRRGQRGRRGGRDDRPEGPPPSRGPEGEAPRDVLPAAAEPAREEELPRDDRPRRGRGRRPPERRPEPDRDQRPDLDEDITDMEPDSELEPAFAAVEEEEDDGPEDNLADLNVPAWPDLIASLYRPDR